MRFVEFKFALKESGLRFVEFEFSFRGIQVCIELKKQVCVLWNSSLRFVESSLHRKNQVFVNAFELRRKRYSPGMPKPQRFSHPGKKCFGASVLAFYASPTEYAQNARDMGMRMLNGGDVHITVTTSFDKAVLCRFRQA